MMRSFQVADEDSANGWSRTTTAGRRRLYRPLSSPVLGVRRDRATARIRTGTAGITTPDAPVTPQSPRASANDRIRTGGLPVDSRALFTAELRSRDSAGGIRTHGLELMRLARTASPLPRSLPGWIRTSALRFPKPAGCPASLQADRIPPAGLEPAASRLRAGRHHPSTTGAYAD